MQPVTGTFLAAIRTSHTLYTRVEAWRKIGGVDTRVGGTLEVLDGQVSNGASFTSSPRRSLTLELAPTKGLWDALAPAGTTLKVWRGVRYVDGSVERVPLGVFDIDEQSMSYSPSGTLSITAPDVWVRVQRAKFERPRLIFRSGGLAAAINLASEAIGLGVGETYTTNVGTRPTIWPRSREEAVNTLAAAAGAWIYTDTLGRVTARPVPYLNTTPVWTVDASVSGVLLDATRARSRQRTYNVVVMTDTAADGSVPKTQVIVADDDPASPTWVGGSFGRVPYFRALSVLESRPAMEVAAKAILRRVKGLAAELSLTAAVNPALEPGDVIQVVLPSRAGDTRKVERHMVDSVTVPLTAEGTQSIGTRSSRPEGDVAEGD